MNVCVGKETATPTLAPKGKGKCLTTNYHHRRPYEHRKRKEDHRSRPDYKFREILDRNHESEGGQVSH